MAAHRYSHTLPHTYTLTHTCTHCTYAVCFQTYVLASCSQQSPQDICRCSCLTTRDQMNRSLWTWLQENKKEIYLKLINHFNARSLRGFMTPEVCTHWHPRTLLFYNLELIIYAAASGNYSHPQKLFTSNSQLQLNSEALSFFAYKPRFVSLSCFSLASLFFFYITDWQQQRALYKLPALCQWQHLPIRQGGRRVWGEEGKLSLV